MTLSLVLVGPVILLAINNLPAPTARQRDPLSELPRLSIPGRGRIEHAARKKHEAIDGVFAGNRQRRDPLPEGARGNVRRFGRNERTQ